MLSNPIKKFKNILVFINKNGNQVLIDYTNDNKLFVLISYFLNVHQPQL